MLRFFPRHSARGCEGTHQSGPHRSRPRPDGRRAGVREQGKILCRTGVATRKGRSRSWSASIRKRLRETLTRSWLWPEFERGLIWTAFPSLRTEQGDQGLTIPTFTKPIRSEERRVGKECRS